MEQHVQVPTHQVINVSPNDLLVYASIKRYDGEKTHPSLKTIKKVSGLSIDTIRKSLKTLEEKGYITIEKKTKTSSLYHFSEYKKFEMFSFDFLDMDISSKHKAFYIMFQQYVLKNNETQEAICRYSDVQLAQKMGLNYRTVHDSMKYFQDNDYILISPDSKRRRDQETGLMLSDRKVNTVLLNQTLIFKKLDDIEKKVEDKVSRREVDAMIEKAVEKALKKERAKYAEDAQIIL